MKEEGEIDSEVEYTRDVLLNQSLIIWFQLFHIRNTISLGVEVKLTGRRRKTTGDEEKEVGQEEVKEESHSKCSALRPNN